MRGTPARPLAVAVLAVAAVALASGGPETAPEAAAAAAPATSVGVSAREWRLTSYRSSVRRGRVAFNVHNYGEDAHNLQVSHPGRFRSRVTPDIEPGENGRLVVTLSRKGTYSLLCIKPGHLAKGMRTTIRVR